MIIIYTMEATYIKSDADAAVNTLKTVYGEKLGLEAYNAVKSAPEGTRYQKFGGPLVSVVSRSQADLIRNKENNAGILVL